MAVQRTQGITRERWERIKSIFEAALERPAHDRSSFVSEACAEDESLRSEVESLLAGHDQAGSFMDAPAFAAISTDWADGLHERTFQAGNIVSGRFEILRFIAEGGMGEVYAAKDVELGLKVALKTIRSEIASDPCTLARFKQELQLARRITHPNVCRVFDLAHHQIPETAEKAARDVTYLTMELLEGETLAERLRRGRMTVEEALPLIRQMAEALNAAHSVAIIHRDFKPSNVILCAKQHSTDSKSTIRVVVTDFGLARNLSMPEVSSSLTDSGQVLGTLGYMAPEQIEGAEATHVTDIYALGLIMYEMLTGKKPFAEKSLANSLVERLKGPLLSLGGLGSATEAQIERLIRECLAVDPRDRIQEAMLIAASTGNLMPVPSGKGQGSSVSSSQASIAVLPFIHLGVNPADEYFSDGLTEELMTALASVEGLKVVARTSVFSYRNKNLDVRKIANRLGANLLMEGTVRRDRDRLRITVRLVNATDGHDLWSERYDRQLEDIFAIQEEIAERVAQQLKINLGIAANLRLVPRRTKSLQAHNSFLKGRFFWNKRTRGALDKAIECFGLAVADDPNFAPALVGLADCHVIQGIYGIKSPQEVFPLAKEIISKARMLASTMAEVHCAAGCVQAVFDWDWATSEHSFLRSIELDPTYATAHHWYAINCLIPQGRFVEARKHLKIARDTDPLSLPINVTIGLELYFERRYEEAVQEYLKVLEMDPNFGMAHFFLGQAYEQKGNYNEAISALERSVTLTERSAESLALLGRTYALAGQLNSAHTVLEELTRLSSTRFISPVLFAQLWLGLNNKEQALQSLKKAVEFHAVDITWLGVRPAFDPIRNHVLFRALCRRLSLPNLDPGVLVKKMHADDRANRDKQHRK